MGSIKNFLDWVKGEDVEDDFEEFVPRQQRKEAPPAPSMEESLSYTADVSPRRSNKVVNINATTQLAVVLVKPDRFENAAEIADHLKDKRTVRSEERRVGKECRL